MWFKNILKVALIATAVAVSAISCTDNDFNTLKVDATIASEGFDGITVNFAPTAGVERIRFAYGSQLKSYSDSIAFERGTLSTISLVEASTGSFTIHPAAGEPVVIFLRGVDESGQFGETVTLTAEASPVPYSIEKASIGSFVYKVGEDLGGYIGISMLAMDATTPDDWGMSAMEIIDMYAMYAMLEPVANDEKIVELNGEPNYDHIVGVVYWKEDYSYDIKTFDFTSGSVVSGAPKASIEVSVNNIASESADLVFNPDDNTCGYFYRLFTKEDYDAARAEASQFGIDPDEHVRNRVAAGGSMNYKAYTDSRTYLSSNTDYVLTCYPYNVNGSQGWGDSQIISFKTK